MPTLLFLLAIIIPPVCVLFLLAYSVYFWRKVKQRTTSTRIDRSSVSYPSTTPTPALPPTRPHSSFSPHPFLTDTQPDYLPARAPPPPPVSGPPHLVLSTLPAHPAPPPVPPSPSASAFHVDIRTSVSRKGTRVLSRHTSSNQSHGSGPSNESLAADGSRKEKRRSKPEKAKRVRERFGIGDGDESHVPDWEGQLPEDTVVIDMAANRIRRRTTWQEKDLEGIVTMSSPPLSPTTPMTGRTRFSDVQIPYRPPPGAYYGDGLIVGGAYSSEGSEQVTPEGSGESGGALLAPSRRRLDGAAEIVEVLDETRVEVRADFVVRDFRQSRGRPHSSAPTSPVVDRRFSDSSALFQSPDDSLTISAESLDYFSTSVASLPPTSASQPHPALRSIEYLPEWLQPSSQPPHMPYTPQQIPTSQPPRPAQAAFCPHRTSPTSYFDPRSTSHLSVNTLDTTKAVENVGAPPRPPTAPPSAHVVRAPPPRAATLPPALPELTFDPISRRHMAVPAHSLADLVNGQLEELTASEVEAFDVARARRPISWMSRMDSSGTLPEGTTAMRRIMVRSTSLSPSFCG